MTLMSRARQRREIGASMPASRHHLSSRAFLSLKNARQQPFFHFIFYFSLPTPQMTPLKVLAFDGRALSSRIMRHIRFVRDFRVD